MVAIEIQHAAATAFDSVAPRYDELFTSTPVGRFQRMVIWKQAVKAFRPGSRVLELNCGTGQDAIFLARSGIVVTACDASPEMIKQARIRKEREAPEVPVEFHVLPNERLQDLDSESTFDGVFSNFSGLNCVADLSAVFDQLAVKCRPGAQILLCLSTRVCAWEILHYLSTGEWRKAVRRCRGKSTANLDGRSFPVYYPTVRSLRSSFEQAFQLRSLIGVGITVPPSYLNPFMSKYPSLLGILARIDAIVCRLPIIRVVGDHMLLQMERV
jgi:ubiquinone/menaquinone biosynthesis C-methylase UbiE